MKTTRRTNWLQRVIVIMLLIPTAFMYSACSKEEIEPVEEVVPDEYYIKYEITSTTIYYGGKLNVTIRNENGQNVEYLVPQNAKWSVIIGPVKKGHIAYLKAVATYNTHNKLRLYSNVYVSKNGSPFALKNSNGSDTPRESMALHYVIEY